MGRNKREQLEFHFYEIPQGESVRTLMGDRWQRVYGHKCKNMHFHNLMQIGICHQGSGVFTLDNRDYPYTSGAVVIIPANCPHYIYSEQEAFWEFMLISSTKMLLELFPNSKKVHEEKSKEPKEEKKAPAKKAAAPKKETAEKKPAAKKPAAKKTTKKAE